MATWHLALPSREPTGYGRGLIELLHAMTATRRAARALGLVPEAVLDRVYGVIARNRSRLGRLVPDRPGPLRFP